MHNRRPMPVLFLGFILFFTLIGSCSDSESSQAESSTEIGAHEAEPIRSNQNSTDHVAPKPQTLNTVKLVVRDLESSKTIANADVYLISDFLATDEEHFDSIGRDSSWERWVEGGKKVGQTDAHGKLGFTLPQDGFFWVVAKIGEKYGDAYLNARCASELTIEVQEDQALRVQIRDSAGQPVQDVSVGISASKTDTRVIGVRQSDKSGWVEFKHPKRWLKPWARSQYDNVVVGIAEIFDPPVRAFVGGFDKDASVVLPPFGSLKVKTNPIATDSVIHLAVQNKRKKLVLSSRPGFVGRTERRQAANTSELLFPCIGLDIDLEIQRQINGLTYQQVSVQSGPGMMGQVVACELPDTPPSTYLPCRIVDIKGNPLNARRVACRMSAERTRPNRFVLKTDENGRAKIPFVHSTDAAMSEGEKPKLPIDLGVTFRADGYLQNYKNNFGQTWRNGEFLITLEPTRLIAAGVVKDGLGKPLPAVHISLELLRKSGYFAHNVGRPIVTDQNGRFAIYAGKYQGIYRIKAQRFDHENAFTSHIELGSSGLEIRMEKKGKVTGVLYVDDVLDSRTLNALFRERGKEEEIAFPFRRIEKGKHSLEAAYMVPGTYDFIVVENDVGGRLFRIQNLRIPFRGDQDPKELNPIDLRGKFRDLKIRVLDKDDKPLLFRFVELASPEGADVSYRQVRGTNDQGIVTFRAPIGPLSATVTLDQENNFEAVIDSKVPEQTIKPIE